MPSGYLGANGGSILLDQLFQIFDRGNHAVPIFRLEDITSEVSLPAAMKAQNTLDLKVQDFLVQLDNVGIELFFQPRMIRAPAGS